MKLVMVTNRYHLEKNHYDHSLNFCSWYNIPPNAASLPLPAKYAIHNAVHTRALTLCPFPCNLLYTHSLQPLNAYMHLDKVLAPEIRPKVNNLPRTQSNKHAHGANSKPLDSLIGTLIRIPKPLLTPPQVIHFPDNLANDLFDPTQFGLDGLELLAGRDGVPVLCVGTNVNVEFDMAGLD